MSKFRSRKPAIPVHKTKGGAQSAALFQLAISAHLAGKLTEAEEAYRQVLTRDKHNAVAHSNLGALLKMIQRLPEAEVCCRRALELKPDYADAHNNLGALLVETNRQTEAEPCFRRALALMPDNINACLNLAGLLQNQKRFKEAFYVYTKAAELKPADTFILNLWAQAFKSFVPIQLISALPISIRESICIPYDESVYKILARWLTRPESFVSDFARPTYQLLKFHPVFNRVLLQMCSDQWATDLDYDGIAQDLSSIPLLIQIMSLSHAIDPELETMLSRLRKAMLLALPSTHANDYPATFSVSLAMLCFDNDYVFYETEQERILIESVAKSLLDLNDEDPVNWHALVVLSSYRPLHGFPWSGRLLSRALPESLNGLIRQQEIEPDEERRIRGEIAKFGQIDDSVSCAVQDMYQGSPYPRWVKPTFSNVAVSFSDVLSKDGCVPAVNDQNVGSGSKILVAGCGTGQQSMMASSRYLSSQITAIDLSLTSLAYATRKSREHGVANVRYMHGDILQLASLGEQFDLIECVGVLHHMADPMSGLRVLADVLKPGGIMKIGLYSERARESIIKIRETIAAQHVAPVPDEIRKLRQEILAKAASGDFGMQMLMGVRDFFSLNECVDLLFHVQEHRFSLLKIESMIKELGLRFLGFSLPNRDVMDQFYADRGADADPGNLVSWDEFEQHYPNTFIGMYVFWVAK